TIAAFIIFLTILCILVFRMHPSRLRGSPLDIITVSIIVYVSYFLLTPIVYPWYLTLFVLLLALRPMISLALLTLTVSASYTVFGYLHTTGEWHYPVAAQLIVWVPFILFFMLEIRRILFGRRQGLRKPYGQRISIIIPAYNEQHIIRECIEHAADEVLEIIVVDGGSTDSTVDAALDAGARVIVHELPFTEGGGRGGQIHAGLIEAAGDIAVILHAETLLRPGQMRLIKEIMALNPELSGGAIGIEFEQATFRSELMITATDLVSGCFGLTMGGQVQFFRREWVLASGIFPDIPLMEDIELSMRLKSLGPTIYLWESTVSRGYLAKRQSWNRVILIIRLATAWLIHRMLGSPDPVAFFKTYYKK
ncbi:MAG TPA: glycosyltransferase, partial [bacterium]|nr:glycosyltransferase [bacterium]